MLATVVSVDNWVSETPRWLGFGFLKGLPYLLSGFGRLSWFVTYGFVTLLALYVYAAAGSVVFTVRGN
jgi:hypothetical protein